MLTEADTCRKFVLPKLQEAGWDTEPHSLAEQRPITDGRVVLLGEKAHRRPPKRPDYLLRFTSDFTLAVLEAKSVEKQPTDGLQQAKEYALMLGLQFAYSTNGEEIVEFDSATGRESRRNHFPKPQELWTRYRTALGITEDAAELLENGCNLDRKNPRGKEDITHLPPEQLAVSILEKEQRIIEIMKNIQKLLAEGTQ